MPNGKGRGQQVLGSATKLVDTIKKAYGNLSPAHKNDLQALLDFPGSPDPTDLLKLGMVITPKTIGKFQSLYKNILRSYLENPDIPSEFPSKAVAFMQTRYPSWMDAFSKLEGKIKILPKSGESAFYARTSRLNPFEYMDDYPLVGIPIGKSSTESISSLAHELMHFNQWDRPGKFKLKIADRYGSYPWDIANELNRAMENIEIAQRYAKTPAGKLAGTKRLHQLKREYFNLPYEREAEQAAKTATKAVRRFQELGGIF